MIFRFYDETTSGVLELWRDEPQIIRHAYIREEILPQYAILWNRGTEQTLVVDGIEYPKCCMECSCFGPCGRSVMGFSAEAT